MLTWGPLGDELGQDLQIWRCCKAGVDERASPSLSGWCPLEVVCVALDKHLNGEEQWVVGYMDKEFGAEIWKSARVEPGGRRGRGKRAEGWAWSCSVNCSICERGA